MESQPAKHAESGQLVGRRAYKKKHVNRQTEAIYLQRLASSEAHKRMPRSKRLDDF